MSSKHRAFYVNTAWQYGLQVIKYILPLITLPYLTRVLETSGYAIYSYVLSFMSFAQVLVDYGFNLSGTKQIAQAKDRAEESLVFGSITQARLMLCLVVGIVFTMIGLNINIIRNNPLYTILAYVAVCGRAMAPDFIFQGKERMGALTTRYLVSKGTSTVLTFVLVHSEKDLIWIPCLDIIASTIAFFWSLAAVKRMFNIEISFCSLSRSFQELSRSGYYCLSNLASSSFSGLTTLVIGIALTDSTQIAYWSLAMTSIGAVQSLYTPIINSLYPHMVVGSDYRFAKKLAIIALPILTAGTLLYYYIADTIIIIIGGTEYLPGTYILRTLTPVLWFSFYGMFFGWPILGAIGKVRELTITTVLSAAVGLFGLIVTCYVGKADIVMFAIVRNVTEIVLCTSRYILSKKAIQSLIVME